MTKVDLRQLVDRLPDGAVDGAAILLEEITDGRIDPEQAWFWTRRCTEGVKGGRRTTSPPDPLQTDLTVVPGGEGPRPDETALEFSSSEPYFATVENHQPLCYFPANPMGSGWWHRMISFGAPGERL
jgi:hypothetical protein